MNLDLEMQVVHKDGKVVMLFSRRESGDLKPAFTDHMSLPPQTAIHAAQASTDMAFEADTNLKPVGPTLKASLVQQHRDKLIPRINVMLNSLRENREVTNGQLALQIMDTVCAEIFQ